MSTPKVSIGLPVFNGENFLAEAIDSILAQTFTDFELIICDNASTDRTEDICRAYQQKHPRISYVRQPRNLGACQNYDMTFNLSRGEYFKWAAHDDVLAPTFLEKLVPVLDADPMCVLAHSKTILTGPDGSKFKEHINPTPSDSASPAVRLKARLIPHQRYFPVFGLCRRSAMAKTPLHGDYMGSDLAFMVAMILEGRWRSVPEGLIYIRLHPQQSTRTHNRHDARQQWFRGRKSIFPILFNWRLLWGYLVATRNSSIGFSQELPVYKVLIIWTWRNRREFFKELCLPLYYNGERTALMRAIAKIRRKAGL